MLLEKHANVYHSTLQVVIVDLFCDSGVLHTNIPQCSGIKASVAIHQFATQGARKWVSRDTVSRDELLIEISYWHKWWARHWRWWRDRRIKIRKAKNFI